MSMEIYIAILTTTFKGIPEHGFCGANALLSGNLKWRVFVNTNKCHCKLSAEAGCWMRI